MSKPDIHEKLILTRESLSQFEPISNLSDERLDELVSLSYIEAINIGSYLFSEGENDNQTIYLLKGDIQLKSVLNQSEIIVKSHAEECKYPLDESQPRQCSAIAMSYVEIIRIDNSVLEYMMMWDQLATAEISSNGMNETENREQQAESKNNVLADIATADSSNDEPVDTQKPHVAQDTQDTQDSQDSQDSQDTRSSQDKKLQETINLVTSVIDEQIQQSVNESKVVYTKENEPANHDQPEDLSDDPLTIQSKIVKIDPPVSQENLRLAKNNKTPNNKNIANKNTNIKSKPVPRKVPKKVSNKVSSEKSMPQLETTETDDNNKGKHPIVHDSRDWIRKIRQIMAFKNMPPANIKNLLEKMETIEVKEGEQIIEQGSSGDYYYVITDGAAVVTRTIELAKIGPGNSFGEEALVAKSPRNASVKMTSDGVLMRLAKKDFDELLIEPLMARVSPEQARSKILQGAKWLDVRHAKEFHRSRLPGAINIPLHELRIRIEELDKETEYICCCRSGARSSSGSFLLAQNGYKVCLLIGGIQAMSQDLRR